MFLCGLCSRQTSSVLQAPCLALLNFPFKSVPELPKCICSAFLNSLLFFSFFCLVNFDLLPLYKNTLDMVYNKQNLI